MEQYRAILEVLRFLSFQEVLKCGQVCALWCKVTEANELWQRLGEDLGLGCSSKLSFRADLLQCSLFVQKHRQFGVYNCILKTWQRVALEKRIFFSYSRSHLVLPDGLMITCGGTHKHAYTYHLQTRKLKELPPMPKCRQYPGLCADSHFLYVFGGSYSSDFESCVKLCLQSWKWMDMPDMLEARRNVHPCRLETIIYLCGSSFSCEKYDIERDEFSLLPLKLEFKPRFGVIFEGELVVITTNSIYRKGVEIRHNVDQFYLCSQMNPIVLQDKVFFSRNWDTIYSFDIRNLNLEQLLPSPEIY